MYLIRLLICVLIGLPAMGEAKSDGESGTKSVRLTSLLRDAVFSYQRGDLYRSYKLFQFLLIKRPDILWKKASSEFVKVNAELSSPAKFDKFCKLYSQKGSIVGKNHAKYQCALVYLELGNIQEARAYLDLITSTNFYPYRLALVRATVDLGLGDIKGCFVQLRESDRKLFRLAKLGTEFTLTRARCYVRKNAYVEAVKEYQLISSSSLYYIRAVEEMAWVHFKLRDIAAVNTVLNVVFSAYDGDIRGQDRRSEVFVDSESYFRARYLQAYLELVRGHGVNVKDKFSNLGREFTTYYKRESYNAKDLKKAIQEIKKMKLDWVQLSNRKNYFWDLHRFVKSWVGNKAAYRLGKIVRLHIAARMELARFKKKKFQTYRRLISKLKKENQKLLENEMKKNWRLGRNLMTTVSLKAKLGKKHYSWIKKTEGLKSLDDALQLYTEKEKVLDDYMGAGL